MGSTESMVWPPAMGIPASLQTDWPPARMAPMVPLDSTAMGMPTIANAMMGLPAPVSAVLKIGFIDRPAPIAMPVCLGA